MDALSVVGKITVLKVYHCFWDKIFSSLCSEHFRLSYTHSGKTALKFLDLRMWVWLDIYLNGRACIKFDMIYMI